MKIDKDIIANHLGYDIFSKAKSGKELSELQDKFDSYNKLLNIINYIKGILEEKYQHVKIEAIRKGHYAFNVQIQFKYPFSDNREIMSGEIPVQVETDFFDLFNCYEGGILALYGEPFNHAVIDTSLMSTDIVCDSKYSPFFDI